MKSFSVLTVSKRDKWFDRACAQIQKQVKPVKWVIVPEVPFEIEADLPCPVEFYPAPMQVRASNLNASLNEGLRHIDTDFVIFYQDFIDLSRGCFSKLLSLVDDYTFVTTCTPNYNGSDDVRFTGVRKPRKCLPNEWESNVAIAPMSVIRALGGFEEELDNGWSWDNVNLAERAGMLGCNFILDESNRPKLLSHEQTSKLKFEVNAERHEQIMNEIRTGLRPLRCTYL